MILIDQFNDTMDSWVAELQQYKFDELLVKPNAASWSLGQVYIHLIEETKYYIEQIEFCLNRGEYASEKMRENTRAMFLKNEFPDVKIKGDPFISENVQQPVSKQELQEKMLELKQEMGLMWNRLIDTGCTGKAKHPGLGYFGGIEWVQYAGMHLRHHLKQKERIDHFLRKAHD